MARSLAAATILAFARAYGGIRCDDHVSRNIPGKTQTMSVAIYTAVQMYTAVQVLLGSYYHGNFLFHHFPDELLDGVSGAERRWKEIMALYVDIVKKCGNFLLKVKFTAEKEVLGLLGASGCGKSMTLKCIAGIEKPDKGVIRLDDKVFFDSEKRIHLPVQKRRVGYLFQDYALFPNMTVLLISCAVQVTGRKHRSM